MWLSVSLQIFYGNLDRGNTWVFEAILSTTASPIA